jgi:nitroimidazol reductase NimA-like FMN-containing flavoprotein (pyridoxamine 5'-phosphate oxidase superfamily)
MWEGEGLITDLTEDDCWMLLGDNELGRIALHAADQIDIFPINYFADDHSILIRTAPGTKLLEIAVNSRVAFEIDGYSDTDAWSVVLKGTARRLEKHSEIAAADALPLVPWIPTLKYDYVRIVPTEVHGLQFARGAEPERL